MNDVFGITGWKNSGKTTLVSALVSEFTRRGFTVSTIKHAHDSFDIDHANTDTFKHREAGAGEVAILSDKRWALTHEVKTAGEIPSLDTILRKLAPCNLVLVEGFKTSTIPKIECIRSEFAKETPIWKSNDSVMALAVDTPDSEFHNPQLELDDIASIADFIAQYLGLGL